MPYKNIKAVVSEIAKRESKKTQVSVGNVREVVGHVCDIIGEDPFVMELLTINAAKRAKRKK